MRFSRTVLRVLAFGLLAAVLVGVPVVVLHVVGTPMPGADDVGSAWRSRQLSSDLVVRIGAAVFTLLWLWFAVTALAELWHVIAWRFGGPGARLAPLPPGPSGLIRGVVRFIALSSVSATATFGTLVPLVQASVLPSLPHAATAVTVVASAGASSGVMSAGASGAHTHRATGRETPYSLAAAVGRPELRERIIELNAGRLAPSGQEWQGGVFPAGMEVVLPQEHVVSTPLGPAHVVEAGDSYWEIADDHLSTVLERRASPSEVLGYTEDLMAYNHPLLGHRAPALIVPGELVVLTDTSLTESSSIDTALNDTPLIDDVQLPPTGHELALPDVWLRAVADPAAADAAAVVPVVVPDDVVSSPVAPRVLDDRTPSAQVQSSATDRGPGGVLSYTAGLGAALMLSAGAVGLLETRRRRQLRASTVGARLTPPLPEHAQTEVLLRSLDASERLARLDLALRSAAPALAAQRSSVSAALLYDTGEVCLFLRGSAAPHDAAWKLDPHANTWRLSASTSLAALAQRARLCAQPCPAMVHLGGVAEGGELFVDLEAVGTFTVHSPHARRVLRSIAASLAVSPFIDVARVFTVGLDDVDLCSPNSERVDSLEAALDAAALALGSIGHLARGATTFNLRVTGAGGEAWEPAIVVAAATQRMADGVADGEHADATAALHHDLCAAATGGRGMAVVTDMAVAGAHADGSWRLVFDDGHHVLEPLGVRVQPVGLSGQEVADVAGLLAAADEALIIESPVSPPAVVPTSAVVVASAVVAPQHLERDWVLLVRLFGQVQVVSRDEVIVECERSKATELIVWLGLHRERPTRGAARTALWDLDVRDATFANVVSDARRAMARAVAPAAGEEWIARTLTEELPLHGQVVTDAELLSARLERSRGLRSLDAIEVLRPGVDLLAGMPLAGTGYLWPDAEGITSSLVLLATGAAIELANHYLLLGDVDGVFWATGQGLKVLSGHEELISLRMRAHARRGDLAGVRGEWESYERALAADSWAAAEPAAKLVSLRRELLAANRALAVEGA